MPESPEACNFIKKETLAQVFSCESWDIFKNTFFTEHVWAIASVISLPEKPEESKFSWSKFFLYGDISLQILIEW